MMANEMIMKYIYYVFIYKGCEDDKCANLSDVDRENGKSENGRK